MCVKNAETSLKLHSGYKPLGCARPGHKMQMCFNKIPPEPAYMAFAYSD